MKGILWGVLCLMAPAWALAQNPTPVGDWKTIDDKTGQARSIVTISEKGGVLTGRISQSLNASSTALERCEACTDDRKNQPIIGLEIIRDVKPSANGTHWEGGQILDPEEGKLYRVRLTPIEGGRQLQVRGYLGPFWRTQVWVRP